MRTFGDSETQGDRSSGYSSNRGYAKTGIRRQMSYSVEYEPEALADLERLTQAICERVINKITWLAENFDQITPQALTADLSGFLN